MELRLTPDQIAVYRAAAEKSGKRKPIGDHPEVAKARAILEKALEKL